jgi:hypothetical protein
MTTITSETAIVDYEEYEGDTLKMDFTWQDSAGAFIDLTSHTAKMEVRAKAGDDAALVTLTNSLGITLGNAASNILAQITASQTSTIGKGKFVYDIELTDGNGDVNTLIAGKITLKESVTK